VQSGLGGKGDSVRRLTRTIGHLTRSSEGHIFTKRGRIGF